MKKIGLIFLVAAGLSAADYVSEGKLWWAHIQYLASDELQGRNTGSEGYRKAAEYVATEFERFGLRPAGTSDYQQPVGFETITLVPDQSSLALVRGGKTERLSLGQDASLSTRDAKGVDITAPMVFVGYGLVIPEVHYNDLAGTDLHGKVAVYVNAAGPVEAPGNVKSHYSSGAERWAALKKAGAIGIATIANPRTATPEPRNGRSAMPPPPQPAFMLADPALRDTEGEEVAVNITRQGGEKFFAGSPHTFAEITKLAMDNKPLPKFPLAATLEAKAVVKSDSVEAPNIMGMYPGSDPKLKDEYVIFSAHLDHVGVGRPVNGDNIYNGAMDNASGIASVLEVARMFKESGARPKRSVIFLAVTAEEKGELGSRYFAAHPTVPFGQIIADINLDMFLPLYKLKVLEVQGLAESTLGDAITSAAKDENVEVQTDREPEQNRFIRSDQYSFIREGVPSLAFKFGYDYGSPEEKIRQEWVKNIYHKPADDLNQKVDTASAAQFDHIIYDLILRVANDPARPQWRSDSFFRRFAKTTN